jgi:pimeloyl-ACP methyl ester carboxylesterase
MKKIFMLFLSLTVFVFSAEGQVVRTELGTVTQLGDPTIPTGFRNIVWLHGLEGSSNSWHYYDDKTKAERKVHQSFRPAYAGFTGSEVNRNATSIPDAADKVMLTLSNDPLFNTSTNNIFIGHSMGGLVLRSIDEKRTRLNLAPDFGGFITFGTPHQGAVIADNLPAALAFLRAGVVSLKKGPQATPFIHASLFAAACIKDNLTVPFGTPPTPCKSILTLLSAFDTKINSGLGFTTGPSQNLGTKTQFIKDINKFTHTKPAIVVAGDEDGPTLWREAASLDDDFAPSKLPFNQVNDGALVKQMGDLVDVYGGVIWWLDSWLGQRLTTHSGAKSAAWTEGKRWALNAPIQWEFLNGAYRTETHTVTQYGLRPSCRTAYETWRNSCQGQNCSLNDFLNANNINNSACYGSYTETIPITVHHANDGIITEYSALGLPGGKPITVKGVNHQEMMNHPEVTKAFDDKIYSGLTEGFFEIRRRVQ